MVAKRKNGSSYCRYVLLDKITTGTKENLLEIVILIIEACFRKYGNQKKQTFKELEMLFVNQEKLCLQLAHSLSITEIGAGLNRPVVNKCTSLTLYL